MPQTQTIAELRAELMAKEEQLADLQRRRKALVTELGEVDRAMARLGGDGRPARLGRPARRRRLKNDKPLAEYITGVLAGAPGGLRIKEIAAAVQEAGYRTSSKEFYGLVASAMSSDAFKKVGRGMYVLQGRKEAS